MFDGVYGSPAVPADGLGNPAIPAVLPLGGSMIAAVMVCMALALLSGVVIAFAYRIKNETYSKNMLASLIVLPVIVQAVVLLVGRIGGGSNMTSIIGTGVAISGAFALVRFRSVPGNARDIACVFASMAIGVAAGVGQIWFGLIFIALVCAVLIGLRFLPLDAKGKREECNILVTLPDDMDYNIHLSEVMKQYTKHYEVLRVKTSKLGTLFEVRYRAVLKDPDSEKKFIDAIRVKNGNLPIVIKRAATDNNAML